MMGMPLPGEVKTMISEFKTELSAIRRLLEQLLELELNKARAAQPEGRCNRVA